MPRAALRLAQVAPAVPLPAQGRQVFSYRVPRGVKITHGQAVSVPFGKRRVLGIVVDITAKSSLLNLKALAPLPFALTSHQIQFAQWIATTMRGGLGYTLRLFLPPLVKGVAPAKKKPSSQKLVVVPEKILLKNHGRQPIFHAALPPREIARIWHGVAQNQIKTVVGTQKALFLPFQSLKSITVEEEHWPTHKLWDQYPRLHSVDGARELAKIHHAKLEFSGSFPANIPRPTVKMFREKTLVPDLRFWGKQSKKVLVLLNEKGKIEKSLRSTIRQQKLSSRLTIATTKIFSQPAKFDQVIWFFPEFTFTFPDYRSEENGLVLLTRLQKLLPAKKKILIVTRDYALAQKFKELSIKQWYDQILAERKRLAYPPFSSLILLSFADHQQAVSARQWFDKDQVQGPFNETNLLLRGPQADLTALYAHLPVDRVDLNPQQILQ